MSLDIADLNQVLADYLITQMENTQFSPSQASRLAKMFLRVFPKNMSEAQTLSVLENIDQEFFSLLKRGEIEKAEETLKRKT